MEEFDDFNDRSDEQPSDLQEVDARDVLKDFFNRNRTQVFFSRQLEVRNEKEYFHWITNRAIRDLENEGFISAEWRKLNTGLLLNLFGIEAIGSIGGVLHG